MLNASLSRLRETRRPRDGVVGDIPSGTRRGDVARAGACVTPTRRLASGRRNYDVINFILFLKIRNITVLKNGNFF